MGFNLGFKGLKGRWLYLLEEKSKNRTIAHRYGAALDASPVITGS